MSKGRLLAPHAVVTVQEFVTRRMQVWTLHAVECLEELRRLHSQASHNFEDVQECEVVLASLDSPHVAAIDPAKITEGFLGQPASLPSRANSLPENKQFLARVLRFNVP